MLIAKPLSAGVAVTKCHKLRSIAIHEMKISLFTINWYYCTDNPWRLFKSEKEQSIYDIFRLPIAMQRMKNTENR